MKKPRRPATLIATLAAGLITSLPTAHSQIVWDTSEITKTIEPLPNDKKHVSYQFTATNLGDTPIEIKQIQTSCGCTKAEIQPKTIPPGTSATLHADIDPKQVGERSENKILVAEGGGKQHILTAKLLKVLPYTLSTRELRWDTEETPSPKTLTLTLKPNGKAQLSSARLLSTNLTLKTVEESPTQISWQVTPNPTFDGVSALRIQLLLAENQEEIIWVRITRSRPNNTPPQTIPPAINTPETQKEPLQKELENKTQNIQKPENLGDSENSKNQNDLETQIEELERRLKKIEKRIESTGIPNR
jgi:hypothetical protein